MKLKRDAKHLTSGYKVFKSAMDSKQSYLGREEMVKEEEKRGNEGRTGGREGGWNGGDKIMNEGNKEIKNQGTKDRQKKERKE